MAFVKTGLGTSLGIVDSKSDKKTAVEVSEEQKKQAQQSHQTPKPKDPHVVR